MTESAPFSRLQDLSTALATLVASTAPSVTAVSNGADDGLSALVHMYMLNPHVLRAAVP